MLVLFGNTYFVVGDFSEALKHYDAAIGYDGNFYFALASAAQCHRALGNAARASEFFKRCSEAIERSGDFRRKRERSARALIAVLAANAGKGCGSQTRYDDYAREARDLLGGNLAVDGLSPKFFSPATKRLVSAIDLLEEVGPWAASSSATSR
jgi:tetratricopeptide (TPR) repeat protein